MIQTLITFTVDLTSLHTPQSNQSSSYNITNRPFWSTNCPYMLPSTSQFTTVLTYILVNLLSLPNHCPHQPSRSTKLLSFTPTPINLLDLPNYRPYTHTTPINVLSPPNHTHTHHPSQSTQPPSLQPLQTYQPSESTKPLSFTPTPINLLEGNC